MEQHLFADRERLSEVILLVGDPRGEKGGFDRFESVLRAYLNPAYLGRVYVEADKFGKSVMKIVDAVLDTGASRVVFDVSGGMRVLVAECLLAAGILKASGKMKVEAYVLVESAGGKYVKLPIVIPALVRRLRSPSRISIELVRRVVEQGKVNLTQLAKELSKHRSVTYNEVYRLEKLGLLKVRRGTKAALLTPKEGAFLVYSLFKALGRIKNG